MTVDLLGNTQPRRRRRPARTRFGKWLWRELEQFRAPKGLGWLFSERVHIEPEYQSLMREAGLDSVRAVFETEHGEFLANQWGGSKDDVSRIRFEYNGEVRTFYVKRFWNRRFRSIITRAIRGSLVGRSLMRAEFENIKELGQMGLRIPRLVGYGEQRFCCGLINSYMITEEIPNAMGVDSLVHQWLGTQPQDKQWELKEELITSIAAAVKTMHANGFEHHDLFLRNLIVADHDMSKLYVFDCPHAWIWPAFIMKKRRKVDLAMLDAGATMAFSPMQRMRFLYQYLGCQRLSAEDKAFAREVLAYAAPMRKKQIKRLERSLPLD